MNAKCLLILALASFGASAAPLVSTVDLNGAVGPTVSETVVTPFHRTDAVTTPCGRSVVRTTSVPIVPYAGAGFLGQSGVYPGIIGGVGVSNGVIGGLIGTGAGYVGNGFLGTGTVGYPLIAEGLGGTLGGVCQGVGGIAGTGIVAPGFGGYL